MKDVNPPIVRQAEDLITQIKGLHAAIVKGERDNLRMAIDAGEKLLALRKDCEQASQHDWTKRLAQTGVPRQTAQDYMDMAKAYRPGGICTGAVHMLLSEVVIRVREARKAGKEKQEPQDTPAAPGPAPAPPTPAPPRPQPPAVPPAGEPVDEGEGSSDDEPVEIPTEPEKPGRYPLPEIPGHPAETPPKGGKMGKKGQAVVLSDWEVADSAQRAGLLEVVGSTKFNPQDDPNIEWALWSWNPVTGCRHDCPYCYARDIADRYYDHGFTPAFWPARRTAPQNMRLPEQEIAKALSLDTQAGRVRALGLRNVFVSSMGDLFGKWVPAEWIEAVLDQCAAAPVWNFLFLTKFPNRMSDFKFSANCWVGTTVDCQARVRNAERAFARVKDVAVKWLSCEPLLEPLRFSSLEMFQWVVIGGSTRSTQTPEWYPPYRWVRDLESEVWAAEGKVYEKANLYPRPIWDTQVRVCEYPTLEVGELRLPPQLAYLKPEVG